MRKIQRVISREETISRVPGLFAYLDYTEYGGCVLHTASDSPEGCYGKVVESIEIPTGLEVDGVTIIRENRIYSYRDMMNAYYAYRDDDRVGRCHPFIKFVEEGIGNINLMEYAESRGVTFDEPPVLAPEYIYLAEIMGVIANVRKLRYACELSDYADAIGEHNVESCCLCKQYHEYGGDAMFNLLIELSEEYVRRAELYRTYAREGESRYSLNIPLLGSGKEVGYMDVYSDELGEGEYGQGTCVTITEVDDDGFYLDMNSYTVNMDSRFEAEPCTGNVIISDGNTEKVKKTIPESLGGEDGITLETETRSRLRSLRNGRQKIDIYGNAITPLANEDWLWYYKKGGWYNTRKEDDENYYVDTIKDISVKVDSANGGITGAVLRFVYSIGQRLTRDCTEGECTEWTEDEENQGMVFTEEYRVRLTDDWLKILENSGFSGGTDGFVEITDSNTDLYLLITKYDGVENLLDPDDDTQPKYSITTFPFYIYENVTVREKIIGTKVMQNEFLLGQYKQTIKHSWKDEMMASPIFKSDSLSSLAFRPDVYNDIYIQRGDNAAFERHIRLSEIKTLDDLMQYSNGGYYQVEKLT